MFIEKIVEINQQSRSRKTLNISEQKGVLVTDPFRMLVHMASISVCTETVRQKIAKMGVTVGVVSLF